MIKQILYLIIFFIYSTISAQFDQSNILSSITQNQNLDKIDSIAKVLKYKEGDKIRILTQFTINEQGEIIDIKARGPHKVFEDEAIRVIKMIPKLDPPNLNGNSENPRFALPIIFVIETDKQKFKRQKRQKREKKKLEKLQKG